MWIAHLKALCTSIAVEDAACIPNAAPESTPKSPVFFLFIFRNLPICNAKLLTYLSELRSCVKVEVAILGSPSLIILMVSVDVKQH